MTYTADYREEQPAHGVKRFYTTEQLGEKRSFTPEGFLLCEDVPIARVGTQIYGEHELPGMKGQDGLIRIHRDDDEVFKPAAVLSFAGKPVTNDHPPERVTPDNWHDYSVGTVINPRQGDGRLFDNSFLYADLLVTSRKAIQDILDGKREVSAGYDAEYEQTQIGEGRQYKIIGNHVALVNRGRCGPSCHIGDSEVATKVNTRRSFRDRIMTAFRASDEGALVEELEKVTEMLGEQVAGEGGGSDNTKDEDGHHVVINLHGGAPGSPGGPNSSGGGMAGTKDDPAAVDPAAAADPAAGQGGMAEVLSRLDRIEQALMILAQGDDPDAGADPNAEDPNGGGDGFHDEAATEPDTDEPEVKPSNSLPYGSGLRGKEFDSPQLGTGDRRRTGDQRQRVGDQRQRVADGGGRRTTDADTSRRQQFVGDSSSMQMEFHEAMSRAEMLVPGIKLPTFDAKTPARITFDSLCSLRRNTLQQAYHDQDKRGYIDVMLGGAQPDFKAMTCDTAALIFNGASEMIRQQNNTSVGRPRTLVRGHVGTLSPAEINKANKERYKLN
jgi:hypothetical protein